jgi:hypothetical protein
MERSLNLSLKNIMEWNLIEFKKYNGVEFESEFKNIMERSLNLSLKKYNGAEFESEFKKYNGAEFESEFKKYNGAEFESEFKKI